MLRLGFRDGLVPLGPTSQVPRTQQGDRRSAELSQPLWWRTTTNPTNLCVETLSSQHRLWGNHSHKHQPFLHTRKQKNRSNKSNQKQKRLQAPICKRIAMSCSSWSLKTLYLSHFRRLLLQRPFSSTHMTAKQFSSLSLRLKNKSLLHNKISTPMLETHLSGPLMAACCWPRRASALRCPVCGLCAWLAFMLLSFCPSYHKNEIKDGGRLNRVLPNTLLLNVQPLPSQRCRDSEGFCETHPQSHTLPYTGCAQWARSAQRKGGGDRYSKHLHNYRTVIHNGRSFSKHENSCLTYKISS